MTNKVIMGALLDAAGSPISNAELRFVSTSTKSVINSVATVYKTDVNGVYNISLSLGIYTIQIKREDQVDFRTVCANAYIMDTSTQTLEQVIQAQAHVSDVDEDLVSQMLSILAQVSEVSSEAAESANTATTQAGIATIKATEAASSANDSANSALASAASATQSASSANASATSASAALTSEQHAKTSETNASASATQAASSATASATSATASAASASASETSKVEATNQAAIAVQKAVDAGTSATNAETKATEAATSAAAAQHSEEECNILLTMTGNWSEEAHGYAQTASQAAYAADQSQKLASNYANDASIHATQSASNAAQAAIVVTEASQHASDARAAATSAAESAALAMGGLLEAGGVDLSTGVYPTPIMDALGQPRSCFWKVTVGGSVEYPAGTIIEYGVGDSLVYSKELAGYYKIDNTESVTSVNGMQGAVTIDKTTVGLDKVDNTSDQEKPVSLAMQTALDAKVPETRTINGKALTGDIVLNAEDIGADASGAIAEHATAVGAHQISGVSGLQEALEDKVSRTTGGSVIEAPWINASVTGATPVAGAIVRQDYKKHFHISTTAPSNFFAILLGKAASNLSFSGSIRVCTSPVASNYASGFWHEIVYTGIQDTTNRLYRSAIVASNYTRVNDWNAGVCILCTVTYAGEEYYAIRVAAPRRARPHVYIEGVYTAPEDYDMQYIVDTDPLGVTSVPFTPTEAVPKSLLYPLASLYNPVFTGTPNAATAPVGTNTTQLATTEFVQTAKEAARTSVFTAANEAEMLALSLAKKGDLVKRIDLNKVFVCTGLYSELVNWFELPAGDDYYVHPSSGVTPGSYKNVTVDEQGHVLSGDNQVDGLSFKGFTTISSAYTISSTSEMGKVFGVIDGVRVTLAKPSQITGGYAAGHSIKISALATGVTIAADILNGAILSESTGIYMSGPWTLPRGASIVATIISSTTWLVTEMTNVAQIARGTVEDNALASNLYVQQLAESAKTGLFTVASNAEMVALSNAKKGDLARRTDTNSIFLCTVPGNPGTWEEIAVDSTRYSALMDSLRAKNTTFSIFIGDIDTLASGFFGLVDFTNSTGTKPANFGAQYGFVKVSRIYGPDTTTVGSTSLLMEVLPYDGYGRSCRRNYSLDTHTWGAWEYDYTSKFKPTPAEIGALAQYGTGGADLNTLIATGEVSAGGNETNWPFPGNGGHLYVHNVATNYTTQIAISGATGEIKKRVSNTSGWGAWVTQWDGTNLPYSSGTFTPVVYGGTIQGTATYTIQSGRYTKIGNRVMFDIQLEYSGHTGTGTFNIGGLPFASSVVGNANAVFHQNLSIASGESVFALNNGASFILFKSVPNASWVGLTIDAAASIRFSGSYEI